MTWSDSRTKVSLVPFTRPLAGLMLRNNMIITPGFSSFNSCGGRWDAVALEGVQDLGREHLEAFAFVRLVRAQVGARSPRPDIHHLVIHATANHTHAG
eukprot:5265700-Pyramimonas_sp.AAC.1